MNRNFDWFQRIKLMKLCTLTGLFLNRWQIAQNLWAIFLDHIEEGYFSTNDPHLAKMGVISWEMTLLSRSFPIWNDPLISSVFRVICSKSVFCYTKTVNFGKKSKCSFLKNFQYVDKNYHKNWQLDNIGKYVNKSQCLIRMITEIFCN